MIGSEIKLHLEHPRVDLFGRGVGPEVFSAEYLPEPYNLCLKLLLAECIGRSISGLNLRDLRDVVLIEIDAEPCRGLSDPGIKFAGLRPSQRDRGLCLGTVVLTGSSVDDVETFEITGGGEKCKDLLAGQFERQDGCQCV